MRIVTLACAGIALLALCVPASALSINVVDTETPTDVVSALLAGSSSATSGILNIGSIVFKDVSTLATNTGQVPQSALYTGFNLVPAFGSHPTITNPNGILLTTGIGNVPLTNTMANYSWLPAGFAMPPGTGGDTDLQAITDPSVNSVNSLEFTFTVPTGITSIEADFVFGTEEYAESFITSAGRGFQDVFAVFVDGVNVAFYAGTTPVVTKPGNEGYFNDNDYTATAASPYSLEYDGITDSIHLVGMLGASIPEGGTHTIKIAIGNGGDSGFDSGVFIGNLRATNFTPDNPDVPEPTSIALLGLGLAGLGLVARKRRRS